MPLKLKFGLFVSFIILFSLLIPTVLFLIQSRTLFEKTSHQRMDNVLLQVKTNVNLQVRSVLQTLKAAATSYQQAHDMENSLLSLQKVNAQFKTFFTLNKQGQIQLLLPYDGEMMGLNLAGEPYFTIPFFEQQTHITYRRASPIYSSPSIMITTALEMATREKRSLSQRGVLGVIIPVTSFFQNATKYQMSDNSVIFVLSRAGFIYRTASDHSLITGHQVLVDLMADKRSSLKKEFSTPAGKSIVSLVREPLSGWIIGLEVPFEDLGQHYQSLYRSMLPWILLSLFIVSGISFIFIRHLNISIQKLVEGGRQINEGNLDVPFDLPVHDEFGLIAHHFTAIIKSLKKGQENLESAYRQVTSHQLMKRDMSVAHQIQQAMIPTQYPQRPDIEIAGVYEPAREVGGDVLDYTENQDGTISILIADVSGKGIPAALVMAQTKIIFRVFASEMDSVVDIMAKANAYLYQNLRKNTFVTAIYGKYYPDIKKFCYCNAGHNPAYFYSQQRGQITEISDEESQCLGAWSTFEGQELAVKIEPGDSLLLYTDGATEAKNINGEMFEEIRLKKTFKKYHHLAAPQLIEKIKETIELFIENEVLYDDLTMIIIKSPLT
ncbi:SpoIIE family protein phosphatase [candidate division CSSED10-310 bacterium]|uniref:SpoIIE family protein phosphatase n=1 Tax=candidate division CSSED10-310 bacterium TaxID=2855610 RepID=A0ABV6Z394_UNCC1